MNVDVDADAIMQLKADDRGRVNLGMEYADETVDVVVVEVHGEDGLE